jgi:hypothetical protein
VSYTQKAIATSINFTCFLKLGEQIVESEINLRRNKKFVASQIAIAVNFPVQFPPQPVCNYHQSAGSCKVYCASVPSSSSSPTNTCCLDKQFLAIYSFYSCLRFNRRPLPFASSFKRGNTRIEVVGYPPGLLKASDKVYY